MTTLTLDTKDKRRRLAYGAAYILLQQRAGVRHSRDRGEYIYNANGRVVPDAKIQRALDKNVREYHKNTEKLARQLDEGRISTAKWQERMRREIKDIHRTQYIIGRGGVDAMTPRDWGRLGADLRHMHYNRLDRMALQIADGDLSPAQVNARAKLYMNSSNKQYWRGKTEAKLAAGFVEEQRFLNPAEHCDDCVAYAARGRVPIGTLPPPGEGSECKSNCKCTMKFYKAGDADEQEGGKITLSNKAAKEKLSVDGIVKYIDANSDTALDIRALKEQVRDAAPFNIYGKTSVKLNKLKIQDRASIIEEMKKRDGKIPMKPIVIDSDGFIIDGRHRAVQAMTDGNKTITAYVPITGK